MSKFKIPKVEALPASMLFPAHLKTVNLSTDEIKTMTDQELLSLLNGESSQEGMVPLPLQQVISTELTTRAIKKAAKPHWSVIPSLCLLVIGTVAACVAAFPVLKDLFESHQPAPSIAASPSPASQRTEGKPMTTAAPEEVVPRSKSETELQQKNPPSPTP